MRYETGWVPDLIRTLTTAKEEILPLLVIELGLSRPVLRNLYTLAAH
jgi:hypothetical protein